MRRLPTILAGLFIVITLSRVAWFAADALKAGPMGYVFSAGLGVAVYASSYWTRTQTTRKAAVISLVLFVMADGYFNLTEVVRAIDWDGADKMVRTAAVVYGVFPTCAAALLGWLQSSVNRLPPAQHKPGLMVQARNILERRALERLNRANAVPQIETELVQADRLPEPDETLAEQVRQYMVLHGVSRTTAYRKLSRNGHERKEKIAL